MVIGYQFQTLPHQMGIDDRDYMRRDYRKRKKGIDVSKIKSGIPAGSTALTHPARASRSGAWATGTIISILALILIAGLVRNAENEDQTSKIPATEPAFLVQFPLDINTASLEELDAVPHIGPVRATQIFNSRPFESLDELLEIQGIGPGTLEEIHKYLIIPDTPGADLPIPAPADLDS